jgi:probable F420-dependent oxidoreductase
VKIDAGLMSPDLNATGSAAARLEAQGFGAAWSFESAHDAFIPLVLAAPATQRILLGTAVAIAFARNPMSVAQVAYDVQTISRGRFILGLGTQIQPHIEKRFSMTWSEPAKRMREFVLAIRAIWRAWETGERLSFRGQFYTHTLMTPFFNPGPNQYGAPPIYLAAVGPKLVEVVGEVADGFLVHPLHTPAFLEAVTLPALDRGLAASGRSRKDLAISCQTIVAMGGTPAQIEKARQKARGQISFYGSTPAYRGVLEHHGYGALHPELNRLSKTGGWLEMMKLIDDALFDLIAVSGTPAEVGAKLRARNASFATRTTLMLYDETGDPEAVRDVIRSAAS